MPARKIPIIWSSPKEKEQVIFKYVPDKLRVVRFGCICPPPPSEPVCAPPASVTLSISGNDLVIVFPSGVLMTNYTAYLFNVTDNNIISPALVSNVSVGGTYTTPNGAGSLTAGKQYKIRLECTGSGDPACDFVIFSNTITAPILSYQFIRVAGAGDPGSGNFSLLSSDTSLSISTSDKTGYNVTTWLSTGIASSTTIKIQKDVSNNIVLTRSTSTDNTTYWQFDCVVSSSLGTINTGDTVTITYT